jgi:hypothetical protein
MATIQAGDVPTLNQNTTGSSGSCTGNAATATNLTSTRTNWSTNGVITAVVGQLAWKNYGNDHTIFDASNSTAPNGSAVNNTDAQIVWSGSYPTLMGWNGINTYGVRVDSARSADRANFAGVLATEQATTSGTEKDFTGIPSSANRITVVLNGVSTNGTSLLILRLGTSGGIVSSGYTSRSGYSFGAGVVSNTTGVTISDGQTAADLVIGQFNINRVSGNSWEITGTFGQTGQNKMTTATAIITLGGALDRLRLTSVSSNTFDAGSINILYE